MRKHREIYYVNRLRNKWTDWQMLVDKTAKMGLIVQLNTPDDEDNYHVGLTVDLAEIIKLRVRVTKDL